jgi:hypothetical protein
VDAAARGGDHASRCYARDAARSGPCGGRPAPTSPSSPDRPLRARRGPPRWRRPRPPWPAGRHWPRRPCALPCRAA